MGIWFRPDVRELLGTDSLDKNDIKTAFYEVFEVGSMSLVSPEQFEAWASEHKAESLVTLSRQCAAKVQR
jgi:hypothetical protein